MGFAVENMRCLMDKPTNIRHLSVIGHYNHGRTTLTDSLMASAGISAPGNEPSDDISIDENARRLRIKSTVNSLHFSLPAEELEEFHQKSNGSDFLINLVDTHSDSWGAPSAALRVMDGAVAVIDITEGVRVQTKNLLRQSLIERIKPVVVLNKLDCALLESKITKEELYQSCSRTIDGANIVISTYCDTALGDVLVSPLKGTVAFASALQGWGFTLRRLALRYSKKFGVDRDKMIERLWGDHFFNPKTKEWATDGIGEEGEPLERSFNVFVLDPIFKVFQTVMGGDLTKEAVDSMLQKLEITLSQTERDLKGKQLLKAIMKKFLPVADALLEMVVFHLPSPVTAQRYRVTTLYEGSMEDESAAGIRDCDHTAPLVLNVTKMVPTSAKGRFYAFGRVFSGTVRCGEEVRIQGPKYEPGKKHDLFIKAIQSIGLMMGNHVEPLEDCPAGNIIGLAGIDQFLLKTGTLTASDTTHNMRALRFSVPQFIQVAVGVENPADLPRLIEGLKILSKADSIVEISMSEAGEHLIAAAGESHLAALVKDLTRDYAGVPLTISGPIIQYRESVSAESSQVALSKSQNKHNRFYAKAMPLGEELTTAIEDGRAIRSRQDLNVRARLLADEYHWDVSDARKIWAFGPDTVGPNLLVDCTKGVYCINETTDSCIRAFHWAMKEGVCAEEPMRGVRINIVDVTCMGDAIHRGGGQLIPTMRRVTYAAVLLAQPVLQEPILFVEIQCPEADLGGAYDCVNTRRGQVFSKELRTGTSIYTLKAYIPVHESFGLGDSLQTATSGRAFMQSEFDHWAVVPGSPLEKGSEAEGIVTKIRTRKGLNPAIPGLHLYLDKL
ncbi:Elongation factor 2 [Mycena venus]|uniref:Elongation factor 2 n=1 Tax=Mycena venus TaxID=2733690 RepID=A0A8H6YKG7_9AGAR|nr:Elongation factor 2 [Mycena venus]